MKPTLILGDIISFPKGNLGQDHQVVRVTVNQVFAKEIDPESGANIGEETPIEWESYEFISRTHKLTATLKPLAL